MTRRGRRWKRSLDLIIGLPLAIISSPFIVLLAAASAASFRANPLFIQQRVGRNGEVFSLVKIRSLPRWVPDSADKYQISDVTNTRVGRFLRRHHLDELPQVWHVVQGTMSLVGPRPEMVELSRTFDPVFIATRTRLPPGCTGLWQISTAAERLINERPEFDEHYVEHWTLRLDLWILTRTVSMMLGGASLKDVGQIPTWTGSSLPERRDELD